MIIGLGALAASCYTYKPITIGKEGSWWNESIVRGDHIRLVLKNGQKIQEMKVLQIDSTRIEAMRIQIQPDGSRYELCEVVLVKNIETIRLRKVSWFGDSGGGNFFGGVW